MSRKFFLTDEQRSQIAENFYKKVKQKYAKDADFCRAYGIPPGTLGHWKNGENINLALIIHIPKKPKPS